MATADNNSSDCESSISISEDLSSTEEIDRKVLKFKQRLIEKRRESRRSNRNELKDEYKNFRPKDKKDHSKRKTNTSYKEEEIDEMISDFSRLQYDQSSEEKQNRKNKNNDDKKSFNRRSKDDMDDKNFKKNSERSKRNSCFLSEDTSDHSIQKYFDSSNEEKQSSNKNRNNHDKKSVSHGYMRRDKYDDGDDSDNVYKNTHDRTRRMNKSNNDEETSSSRGYSRQSKDEKRNYKKTSNNDDYHQNNYRGYSRCDKNDNRGDGNFKRKNDRYRERNDSYKDETDSDDNITRKYLDRSKEENQNSGKRRNNDDKKTQRRRSHNDSMDELKNNSFRKRDGCSRRKNESYVDEKSSDLNGHFSRKYTDRSRSEKDRNRRSDDKTVSYKDKNDDWDNPDKNNFKRRNVRNRGRSCHRIEGNSEFNSNKDQVTIKNFNRSRSLTKINGRDESRSRRDKSKTKTSREIYIPPEPTTCEEEIFASSIKSGINFQNYDKILVKITGKDVIKEITSFKESNLCSFIMDNITKSGYEKPTPIQKSALPIIMAGRDVMACAQTGSGKTAAFLLPIINYFIANQIKYTVNGELCQPQTLILVPTRELAIQISTEARKFAYGTSIKVMVIYGGVSTSYHNDQIIMGCHILVSTPGRLSYLLEKKRISFVSIRFLVLDEADRMLDMGFKKVMDDLINHETMNTKRQTLLFSATFPKEIQILGSQYLTNYLFITVGDVGVACSDVQQKFYEVNRLAKKEELMKILQKNTNARTLIFVNTKRGSDFITAYLNEKDLRCTNIHGARLQSEREEALRDFRNGSYDILVATEVAARGLDIKNIDHVINYDLPKNIDEYVHRIGRTGRVGNQGIASSFFDIEYDKKLAPNLVKMLLRSNQDIPTWLMNAAAKNVSNSKTDNKAHDTDIRQKKVNNDVLDDSQDNKS